MDAFLWDQNFVTGMEEVDRQHHHLVDLINRLGDSLISTRGIDESSLQGVFGELADYARYHFGEEERLMAKAGVDARHADPHRHHHAEFVDQVSSMWASRHSMADPAENLHGFLRAWLAFHILGEDQSLARQVAAIRGGKDAATAFDTDAASVGGPTASLLLALENLYHLLSVQNRDLAAANARLEERVAARTHALALANQALKIANDKLEGLSNTDGLLGIANRRYFDRRLQEEWRRAIRNDQALALLMIDVDLFKLYNDSYGHQAGDQCLRSVAQATQAALKRPGDLVARYGGEELAVLLPDTDLDGALGVAPDVQAALAGLHIPHSKSTVAPEVTVSIGAATIKPRRSGQPESLVAAADRGLYAAKQGGRNRICADPT